jgi:hypothetical protein
MVVGVYEMVWKWKWDKKQDRKMKEKERMKRDGRKLVPINLWVNGVIRHWVNERINLSQTTTLLQVIWQKRLVYHLSPISR